MSPQSEPDSRDNDTLGKLSYYVLPFQQLQIFIDKPKITLQILIGQGLALWDKEVFWIVGGQSEG